MHPKIAFVFPGQGSQSIGMLSNLTKEHASIKKVFAEASAALEYDLWQLVAQGPLDQLNQTEFTQPALLTAGVAMWRLWMELENLPVSILAGHSLGEYTALVCADALDLSDAVRLVAARGRLMQNIVIIGGSAMAAVLGLASEDVVEACVQASNETGDIVQAANFNAPGQIVIAGTSRAVNLALDIVKAKGAKKTVLLPVSVPSHCTLMQPIAEQFATALAAVQWRLPKIPVLHNFDVAVHKDIASICDVLVKQLYNPVRWQEIIQFIVSLGVEIIAECGPGKVLTSLNKRISSEAQYVALEENIRFVGQSLADKAKIA